MKIRVLFSQSTSAILANKGRSFLTTLGIIIGIAAVIALTSLGSGVSANVANSFSSLGSKEITINSQSIEDDEDTESTNTNQAGPGNPTGLGGSGGSNIRGLFRGATGDPSLTEKDLEDINSIASSVISSVSPEISNLSSITANDIKSDVDVKGIDTSYFDIKDLELTSGELLSEIQVTNNEKIAVLGSEAATNLFTDTDPLQQTFTIEDTEYTVIGTLAEKESNRFQNPNRSIYIPYSSAFEQFEIEKISTIIVEATSEDTVLAATEQITSLLVTNHGFASEEDTDFGVISAQDILQARASTISTFTNMLTGVAAISLLVGGIGIMNIMLVSVTERTHEIGLRKAVGAKVRHIILQFLIESSLLTLMGGILGVIFGQRLGQLATNFVSVEPVFTYESILLAVGVSIAVGIIFGLYPAYKAARLDPVEALRYE